MQLNDLPDDVLAIVIDSHLSGFWSKRDAFVAGLTLLSTCRRWRHLALPTVFSTVYIRCDAVRRRTDDHSGCVRQASNDSEVDIATNLDLVTAAGCIDAVQRVMIEVEYLEDPMPEIWAVIERMRAAAERWAGVRALEFYVREALYCSGMHYANMAEYEGTADKAFGLLYTLLPRVCELRLGGTGSVHIAQSIYGRLAGCYSEELHELSSNHPVILRCGQAFAQLRYVAINSDLLSSHRLPHMNPESIEHLELTRFPASHSWLAFSSGSNGSAIKFPELRCLDVHYSTPCTTDPDDDEYSDGRSLALQFPALEDLAVSCPGSTCPLLENCVLPARLKTVSLYVGSSVYRTIAENMPLVTRRLSLCISRQYVLDPGIVSIADRILVQAGKCVEKELAITDEGLPFMPACFTCTDLTRLMLTAPTPLDVMLKIIRRQPRLASLTLSDLHLGSIQTNLSIPERGDHELMAPLDTRISELAITMSPADLPELEAAVTKYLLLSMPTLATLAVEGLPEELLADFVNEYSQWYPHLASVSFMLGD